MLSHKHLPGADKKPQAADAEESQHDPGRRQQEAVMLNISLMSQGLPESSRTPSVLPPLSSATSGMQGHQQ